MHSWKKPHIFSRVWQYIRDLDRIGQVAAILGFLFFVADLAFLVLGKTFPIPQWLVFILIVFLIGFANFRLYEKLKRADITVDVKDYSCGFSGPIGYDSVNNTVVIQDGFHLDISGHLNIAINDPELSDAYFHIQSISTNWNLDLSKSQASEVRVEVPTQNQSYEDQNPVKIGGRNLIPNCRFSTVMPIDLPSDWNSQPSPFKLLRSLRSFSVTIGVSTKGGREITLKPFSPDISTFQRNIEENLIQLVITQVKHGSDVVPNSIFALRDFWSEPI